MALDYAKLGDDITVTNGVDAYSAPVNMSGANAVQIDIVVHNLGGATSLKLMLEGSNDGNNYFTATPIAALDTLILGLNNRTGGIPAQTQIAWQFVRLHYQVNGTGTVTISAGASTALL